MNENTNESMGAIIARKRKELGLTQEQLAGELNISYQAVSKWENELSSPDIMTLPLLADLFGITIDELFGRAAPKAEAQLIPAPAPEAYAEAALPWPDDDTLRAVLFEGRRLVGHERAGERMLAKQQIVFRYEGAARNVQSDFDLIVTGDVAGDVSAEGDVDCSDVGGSVSAAGDVDCGDVAGNINAGGDVDCDDVKGSVNAGGDVDCGSVEGSLSAGGDVDCGSVGGDVHAEGDVDCGSVRGRVFRDGDDDDGSGKKKKGFIF